MADDFFKKFSMQQEKYMAEENLEVIPACGIVDAEKNLVTALFWQSARVYLPYVKP